MAKLGRAGASGRRRRGTAGGQDKPGAWRAAAADFAEVYDKAQVTWAAVLQGERADTEERCAAKERRDQQRAYARAREETDDAEPSAGAEGGVASLEKTFGVEDFVGLSFLVAGLAAAQSVGRVLRRGTHHGSGFLVAPDVLATNNHVLSDAAAAAQMQVQFGDAVLPGGAAGLHELSLDAAAFFWTDPALDITLVAVRADPGAVLPDLGFHPLIEEEGKIITGDGLTVIQHPQDRPLSVVVHNSTLLVLDNAAARPAFCFYSTDTERGSSGSPVFSRNWEVIAVHRRGVPKLVDGRYVNRDGNVLTEDEVLADPGRAVWIANEGVRVSRIVKALKDEKFPNAPDHATRRNALLALWNESRNLNRGQKAAVSALTARLAGPGPGAESAAPGSPPATPGQTPSPAGDPSGDIHIHLHFPRP